MSVNLSPLAGAGAQFFTDSGTPLTGGLLYTYAAGTTTPATTYSDSGGLTANANPIVLNAAGRVAGEVWLVSGTSYKFVLKTATLTTIGTWDNIDGVNDVAAGTAFYADTFTCTAGQTTFTLTANPGSINNLTVSLDGAVLVARTDFSWTGTTVVLSMAAYLNQVLRVAYSTAAGVKAISPGSVVDASVAVSSKLYNRINDTISVKDFGAVLDGVTDDYAAVIAACNSLPASGGTVIIPSSSTGMKLATTVAPTKPVRFQAGSLTIFGPSAGWIFDLSVNGSGFIGSGEGATILKLTAPAAAVVLPTAHTTIAAGAVNSIIIDTPGSNLYSTPIVDIGASPTNDDASAVGTVTGSSLSGLLSVANGSGYVGAPAVTFTGGGAGAIKANEIMAAEIGGFTVDTNNIANAVGVYHYGGWYADWFDVQVQTSNAAASSVGFVVDSHTLGVPGPTGSYGGVYASKYRNVRCNKIYIVGHDTSTATTLDWATFDCTSMVIAGSVGITVTNPIIQGAGVYYDLTNVDALTLIGGDSEGAGTMFKTQGSCNNIKCYNTLAYAHTGALRVGPLGTGWDIRRAKSNSSVPPLITGSGGNAGQSYQNTGWNVLSNVGIHYSGDTFNIGQNCKAISATQANLDDTTNGGFVVEINTSGQFILRTCTAGANPRTLTDVAMFDSQGLKMVGLPSANPGAGTKRFWYDATDANRVKFAP